LRGQGGGFAQDIGGQMNVKTGPVRGGSRFRRHRGDKFRLTAQHLFRGLQQEASALGGYRIAPLRERRAGGIGAAAGVRQAGGAGNGGGSCVSGLSRVKVA
jgi:hypothetical protein